MPLLLAGDSGCSGTDSRSGLPISLPPPHTATHPRNPTVLVRDLSTREVAVKWIAHFPYSTVVVGAVAKAERFHVPDQPVDAFGSGVAGAGTGGERGPLAASRQRPIWLPVSFHWDVANSSGSRQSELPPSMQLALV